MGYLIKQNNQIVTAKVTLTSADLLTPGFIYSIPEYPKIDFYFWSVLYMIGEIVNGTTPYVGNSGIHVQASSALVPQSRFAGAYMTNIIGTFAPAPIATAATTHYVQNDNLEIHNPGTLTVGDTELNIYLGAILIRY